MLSDPIEILSKVIVDGFDVRQFGYNNQPNTRVELQRNFASEIIHCELEPILKLERDGMIILDTANCGEKGNEFLLVSNM